VWHILKYSLRIWNNRMKEHDLEEIGIKGAIIIEGNGLGHTC
jgi:hypothetical protein